MVYKKKEEGSAYVVKAGSKTLVYKKKETPLE